LFLTQKQYFCKSLNPVFLKPAILITAFLFFVYYVSAQTCTTLGQNPSTAFPVCGTTTFSQSIVPYCGGKAIIGKCGNDGLSDTNPFWYKFTCFAPGTLGFTITPDDLADDYDWQLFDITGRDPNDIYTDASLFVTCNWSGNPGVTGASSAGSSLVNCAGVSYPTFSSMASLQLNHEYLLLVSHFTKFTPSQKGYTLSFGGGTASITDPKLPALQSISSSCDGTQLFIRLNKKMKCKSLAADGSDFVLSSPASTILSAVSASCNSSFDMDSITLTLSNPLPPGDYTVAMKNGTDGNTLLDNCDRNIAEGSALPLSILPLEATPMDSLVTVECAPQTLELFFKKGIRCKYIAADGSDFKVTGPTAVTVTGAQGNCVNGVSNTITISLANPIVNEGTYKITLVKGTDGNTIIDECAQETMEGSTIDFSVKDTVSADFTYKLLEGCKTDTLQLFHDGKNGISQFDWEMDYNGKSNLQNPVTYFSSFGKKQIALRVSNGFCSDSLVKIIDLGEGIVAAFETNNIICPEDPATFINKSTGAIVSYQWSFANGNVSTEKDPPAQNYPLSGIENSYPIQLIVDDGKGCSDTSVQNVKVLKSCYIAVPSAFTPNGDGLNDFLYPLNAFKAGNLEFKVYNRLGQVIFYSADWTEKWNGNFKGDPQPSGIYVWTLQYTHLDTGKKIFQKGSTVLIR
jgi:gliding motility-associated-like protein